MRHSILWVLAAALVGSTSAAAMPRADRNDTIHASCGLHSGDTDKITKMTPVMQITLPWLPAGSSSANSAGIVDSAFHDLMVARKVKFYKAFCITASTAPEVLRRLDIWEQRSGYGVRKKASLDHAEIFSAMFDRMSSSHSILNREITRARYSAKVVTPVGK